MKGNCILKLAIALLLCSSTMVGQTLLGQVTIPSFNFSGIAVNPFTNTTYVSSSKPGVVTVISGRTRSVVATIPTGGMYTMGVAVNPLTNRIYVTALRSIGGPGENSVFVIDGHTNRIIDNIFVDDGSSQLGAVAVNPITNRIYVAKVTNAGIAVINGSTDGVSTTVAMTSGAGSIAVDYGTNRIYAVGSGQLFVLDGRTNNLSSPIAIPTAIPGNQVAVDVARELIFIPTSEGFSVVSGRTNQLVKEIPVRNVLGADVDPLTNRLWVSIMDGVNEGRVVGRVLLLDATTGAVTSSLSVNEAGLVAVNPVTNTAYVVNSLPGVVDIIGGSSGSK